ncbi:MAG: hypothetical protein FD123_1272 [Bacteroidetes bacterium]|nr:MAG: hypothetical protein FD123_1272 [Bacteroidota bacterium]
MYNNVKIVFQAGYVAFDTGRVPVITGFHTIPGLKIRVWRCIICPEFDLLQRQPENTFVMYW